MLVFKFSFLDTLYFFILFFVLSKWGNAKELVELTKENFDSVVDGNRFVFVIFYAPWDARSIKALKSLEEARDRIPEKDDKIILAKVNAYDEVKLATRFWIDRWPMFKFFLKGSVTPETYRGGLNVDDYVAFVKLTSTSRADPAIFWQPLVELDNSNFERIIHNKEKNVFVLFYTEWCEACKDLIQTLKKVGENFRSEKDCVIAKINSDVNYAVTLQQEIAHYPTIKVYSLKNKDGYIYYPGKYQENWSEQNITKFLNLQCKTRRTTMGRLDKTAGRIDALDEFVKIFMRSSFKRRDLLKEAKNIETFQNDGAAEIYFKTMEKILHEGTGFLTSELDRIERLLQASLHPSKAEELEKRRNILKQFSVLRHEKDEL